MTETGEQGKPGKQGAQGVQGSQGVQGIQGTQGEGHTGEKGPQGERGKAGTPFRNRGVTSSFVLITAIFIAVSLMSGWAIRENRQTTERLDRVQQELCAVAQAVEIPPPKGCGP